MHGTRNKNQEYTVFTRVQDDPVYTMTPLHNL